VAELGPDLLDPACPDCVPTVGISQCAAADGRRLLVVGVGHQASCPWLRGVLPEGAERAVLAQRAALFVHFVAGSLDHLLKEPRR